MVVTEALNREFVPNHLCHPVFMKSLSNPIESTILLGTQFLPTKRLGNPDEVSSAVCFLLSPGASFVSGANLRITGGGDLYARMMMEVQGKLELLSLVSLGC